MVDAGTEDRSVRRVKLWDLPIRVVHWSFVLLLPALWWTWKKDDIGTHKLLGYILLGLLVFRIFWGFAGSETARFSGFVKGPRSVAGYVRRLFSKEGEPIVGHNPLGGWSVVALLGLLSAQVFVGLFTQDVDGIESGPLTSLVSYDRADAARWWHDKLFDALLCLVALHVVAILFYLVVKRDNLVGPMVTGSKKWAAPSSPPTPAQVPLWRMLIGAVLGAGVAWWVSRGCPI
ncbi:MAG TPA: cytochrome b/b6 domain-containing protein [Allosphingosinicella sp.]|jgi:cytochrome b|nr:cytochrome b/b6 domain-containing protein [Allosphingosinicella sp.]